MPTSHTISPHSPQPASTSQRALKSRAALLSSVIPGLGQASRGLLAQATLVACITVLLAAATWAINWAAGPGAAIFFAMLVMLPWWAIQAYDAWLSDERPTSVAGRSFSRAHQGLTHTLRNIWQRAHDIRYLGALFLLTAFTDFYIIVSNPDYALTIFCQKPGGPLGVLAKAQSPTLHTLIGYGFLRLRRWSLFIYLAYAAFGLLNATVNYACFGYGRVRTVFLVSLLAFTAYVIWRRGRFLPDSARNPSL